MVRSLDELLEMLYLYNLFCSFCTNLLVKQRFFFGLLIKFVFHGKYFSFFSSFFSH